MLDPARLRQWLAKVIISLYNYFLSFVNCMFFNLQYQNPDAVYRDITGAVNHYQGLQPQQDNYSMYLFIY